MDGAATIRDPGPDDTRPNKRLRLLRRYILEEEVGGGAMGEVWKAFDEQFKRWVAVKFLNIAAAPTDTKKGQAARSQFDRELDALVRIKTGGLGLYDHGELPGGRLFFVMEWLDGESLEKRLDRRGHLSVDEVLKMLRELSEVLQEVHGASIIHRDVKPGNIFIQKTSVGERYRLVDFGVATLAEGTSASTAFSGTYEYAAPEQLANKATGLSDIYALGVVAYESLTGKKLFEGSLLQVSDAKRTRGWKPPTWPPNQVISVPVQKLVTCLVHPEPNRRGVGGAGELLREIERMRRGPVASPSLRPIHVAIAAVLVAVPPALLALVQLPGVMFPSSTPNASDAAVSNATDSDALEAKSLVSTKAEPEPTPVPRKSPRRKETRRRVTTKPGMVQVPRGRFFMGCNEKVDKECDDSEKPGRTVSVKTFFIDRTEVTVEAYAECVKAGECSDYHLTGVEWKNVPGYADKPFTKSEYCNWGKGGREKHPINCVDWNQASKFCAWKRKRLPTEIEWEKATRGTDGRKYPWGNQQVTCDYAILNDGGYGCGRTSTWPVGSKRAGKSPYGALDMVGNVWEWTSSWWDESERKYRVIRGGSWSNRPADARASFRLRLTPGYRDGNGGFRCLSEHSGS